MKALAIDEFGGPEKMQLRDFPLPEAKSGELRIKINASALNPVDWKIREGYLKDAFPHHFPVILGWDCAGVVDQVGDGVEEFKEGDPVLAYCRKEQVGAGTFASHIVVQPQHCAHRPDNLPEPQAAALPLAGLTAWQALFDAGKLQAGETVLVHAAAGGVGHLAVQLAKNAGARVIGTASQKNHDFLKSLGVDHPVDYSAGDMKQQVLDIAGNGVDFVFDCIGGPALDESPALLNDNGRIITITGFDRVEDYKAQGVNMDWVFVAPNSEELTKLAELASQNKLKIEVANSFPIDSFKEAFVTLEDGHVRGKLVFQG